MLTLSQHYAVLTLPDGTEVNPISISVTTDETWAPYVQASVVVPSNVITDDIDPRTGVRLKLRLQQDFGELVYVYKITADFGGDVSSITAAYGGVVDAITRAYARPWNIFEAGLPISKVTTNYTPVKPSKLTTAGFASVWVMSDYLHGSGTFNPVPSTVFTADLGVRSISYDYSSKEATIELASDEALAQDVHGYGDDIAVNYYNIRDLINEVLSWQSASLQPGTANFTYTPYYRLEKYELNLATTQWDFLNTIVDAAGLTLYCDEQRRWYLVDPTAVAGTLVLNDNDNVTRFNKELSREGIYYNRAVIEYKSTDLGTIFDDYYAVGSGPEKTLYLLKENLAFPGLGAAQSLVERSITRGESYSVEAIANFDARPRQTLTVDITGETVKTGVVQSITWSLPSARMSVDIRDLQEV